MVVTPTHWSDGGEEDWSDLHEAKDDGIVMRDVETWKSEHRLLAMLLIFFLLDGPSLQPLHKPLTDLIDDPNVSQAQHLQLFADAYSKLGRIHDLGICHRDVKPSNAVMRCDFDEEGSWCRWDTQIR